MKLKTAILTIGILAGSGWAQNVIDNTRNQLNAVQQQQTAQSNAALAATQGQNGKPSTSAPKAPAASTAKTSTAAAPQTAPSSKAKGAPVVTVKAAPQTAPAPAKPVAKAAPAPPAEAKPVEPQLAVAVEDKTNPADPKKDAPINMEGHRDPFVSPVVSRSGGGSGCSTGKKCLAVDQISLRGVIRSDAGMIAIVVNALDKAYFLRENDPVFNGYVVKITGDSIIFKESFEDKLGKPLTREVTKRILTPAV
jgi:hypothetical protein